MKTSYILLAILAIITLTGMVATDLLLLQQYEKMDWSNPYQQFDRRVVPIASHVVIEGAPTSEIIVETGKYTRDSAQVFLLPSMANSFRSRKQGDTLFISYLMNYDGERRNPHNDIEYELPAGLVLRLPDLKSLRVTNGRLTLRNSHLNQLTLSLQNTRLRTQKLTVADDFALTASQNSFAKLGPDQYKSLRAVVQDSSGIQLNDSQIDVFKKELSPKADIHLNGRALTWMK
ncbi:hypothetical protein [Spirosoma aerophilum]